MTQILDNTVAVLWGSVERSLTWVHLSPKQGTTVVAKAGPTGLMVRELWPVPNIAGIAGQALWAWAQIKAGQDLADQATHRLAPPHMQTIEPLPQEGQ